VSSPITTRKPGLDDGQRLWQAVKQTGTLDLNSSYLYLLMCDQFADTCILAEMEGELVGFITAFLRPDHPRTLFVWQVGVLEQARGRGVAKTLMRALVSRPVCADIEWVEATVSPGNEPSRALFSAFARDLGVDMQELPYMTRQHFPQEGHHEAEPLLRLGPIKHFN
jgi:L-2,4-diaminobutyric acid acetyltransferase